MAGYGDLVLVDNPPTKALSLADEKRLPVPNLYSLYSGDLGELVRSALLRERRSVTELFLK